MELKSLNKLAKKRLYLYSKNDLLFYPDATVQIYNRWGQLVFDCNNNCYFNSWDGTYEGENLPFGNYYFLINYKENEEPIYGAVTIKR